MKLPEWAEEAFNLQAPVPAFNKSEPNSEALAEHNRVCERWRKRWIELPAFHKDVGGLPDRGKTLVLDRAFYVGRYLSGKTTREAKRELEHINHQLIAYLLNAVRLLAQRKQIKEDFSLHDGMVDLFDSLRAAIALYPEWAYVAERESEGFLRMRGQSRAGPDIADLLDSFVALSDTSVESEIDDVIDVSQKSEADQIRLMLDGIGRLNSECLLDFGIDSTFRISDAAIAQLVNVAFDLPEDKSVEAGAVKRRRQDAKKEGYDYWNGAK